MSYIALVCLLLIPCSMSQIYDLTASEAVVREGKPSSPLMKANVVKQQEEAVAAQGLVKAASLAGQVDRNVAADMAAKNAKLNALASGCTGTLTVSGITGAKSFLNGDYTPTGSLIGGKLSYSTPSTVSATGTAYIYYDPDTESWCFGDTLGGTRSWAQMFTSDDDPSLSFAALNVWDAVTKQYVKQYPTISCVSVSGCAETLTVSGVTGPKSFLNGDYTPTGSYGGKRAYSKPTTTGTAYIFYDSFTESWCFGDTLGGDSVWAQKFTTDDDPSLTSAALNVWDSVAKKWVKQYPSISCTSGGSSCIDFTCSDGMLLKDGADSITCEDGCSDDICCDYGNQGNSCFDFTCSDGMLLKDGADSITCEDGCSDDICCDYDNQEGSCIAFTCSDGMLLKEGAASITCEDGCSDDICCDNPRCDSFSCSANQVVKDGADSIVCNANECTADECCLGKCTSFTCPTGKVLKTGAASTVCSKAVCKETECCIAESAKCDKFNCGKGKTLKSGAQSKVCKSARCTATECCAAACSSLSKCPSKQSLKANASSLPCKSTRCTTLECCSARCTGIKCPKPQVLRANASKIECKVACSAKDCCQAPDCSLFKNDCPKNSIVTKSPNKKCSTSECDFTDCCISSCTRAFEPASCKAGTIFTKNPDFTRCQSFECEQSECCVKLQTCKEFGNGHCPARTALIANSQNVICKDTTCEETECCRGSCDLFSKKLCASGIIIRGKQCLDLQCTATECCKK